MRSRKLLALIFTLLAIAPALAGYMTLLGAGVGSIQPVVSWVSTTDPTFPSSSLTFSRTSLATMFDSTGKLTYAPNNLLTQSNTFSDASWTKVSATITTGVLDRSGGTSASTLTATGAFANLYAFATTSSSHNVIQSIWIRRRTGTGKIWMKIASSGALFEITGQVTSGWTQVSISGAANASSTPNFLQLDTSGDAVDISEAVVSAVTYETSPRTADQVITTSSAYYGPRIDYDPNTLAVKGLLIEEARTNLLVNSKSDGTNLATQNVTVTAQPYTLTFYGTGSVTLSGASTSGPLSGSGAFPTRSTLTFTPSAGTLTLTVAGTVQYAQLEAGSFATSYIPTGASSVTRAADVVQFTGAALTAAQGSAATAIMEVGGLPTQAATTRYLQYGAGSGILIAMSGGSATTVYEQNTAGSASTTAVAGSGSIATILRAGVSWGSSGGRKLVANGGAVATDASNNELATGAVNIGQGQGTYINGWLRSFAIYNQRLPDATLQAKSVVGASY